MLEELIDIEDETERQMQCENETRNIRIEQERGQALEMRERAMESLGQTRKRMGEVSGYSKPAQKRRRSEWLQTRVEQEKEEKELKQAEKREFMEAQSMQHWETMEVVLQNQQQFGMQMQQQQQQQQQMQQQMMALLQQQQQQTQMLANIFQKNFN